MSRGDSAANWLLAATSLALLALLLAGVEGGLRLLGVAAPAADASRLAYQRIELPILSPDRRPDGTPIWRTTDPRLPYQAILREKPANSLRVFVFGGSAAAGLGFSPNATFAHQLERMLEAAWPERSVEVLDLGIVALAARQVAAIVADAAAHYAPDLMIVYSGNNEFLELHAEKYAQANASPVTRAVDLLDRTRLYRLLVGLLGRETRSASLADLHLSDEQLRLTQDEIIRQVGTSPQEIEDVIDAYVGSIGRVVDSAQATGVPLLLVSVASNWEWRGRDDLPEDWLSTLLGSDGPATPARLREAVARLDARLHDATDSGRRHEWLFRRAEARRALGDAEGARDDYRAAMNADPHLRRALDAQNDRLLELARRRGVAHLDLVEALARSADHGTVGFGEFYDYVHFTPRGAVLAAEAIFAALEREGLLPPAGSFDPRAWAQRELVRLASLERDPLRVDEWLGIGFDTARIHDRDLWKYDTLLQELDQRLARAPDDAVALTYRGDAHYFEQDGAAAAARDWRRAAELGVDEARANLEILARERAP